MVPQQVYYRSGLDRSYIAYYNRLVLESHEEQEQRLLPEGPEELKQHFMSVYGGNGIVEPFCLKTKRSFFFEAGTDPLDWIYIFKNEGNLSQNIPRHWHYIGCGLSDINHYSNFRQGYKFLRELNPALRACMRSLPAHHPRRLTPRLLDGLGFELTLRVKCYSDEDWNSPPPAWPCLSMQDLSMYLFLSMNIPNVGDNVAWYSSFYPRSTRIEDTLLTQDPQLGIMNTSRGSIEFIQIVGVCFEELQAAREWNGRGILDMMREREETGGPFLVTDVSRVETLFELDSDKQNHLNDAIKQEGSDMEKMIAIHKTSSRLPYWFTNAERKTQVTGDYDIQGYNDKKSMCYELIQEQSHNLISTDYAQHDKPNDNSLEVLYWMSLGSERGNLDMNNCETMDTRYYETIYILLNRWSARILPIMLNGRLAHRRDFTFQSFKGDSLITFIPEGFPGESMVSQEKPFVRRGPWLQIYVPTTLREQMLESIRDFSFVNGRFTPSELPKNYSWPEYNLHLTVVELVEDESSSLTKWLYDY